MLIIINDSVDAYFNMAMEEYLLTDFKEDIFMLWRNANAIVIGKNQNPINEIDEARAREYKVQIVRRLTGGGAVYHDLGNINYTYIMRKNGEHFHDYKYFATPICRMLEGLGIKAVLSGRNDIVTADGRKISGTAQTMRGEDVLFHGTLLVDSNLNILSECLTPEKSKLARHGIKSVEGRVANLKPLFDRDISVEGVIEYLACEVMNDGAREYRLTDADKNAAAKLASEKYSTNKWIFEEITQKDLGKQEENTP